MSLADELLADLEDTDELQYIEYVKPTSEESPMEIDAKIESIRQIAKLRDSEQFAKTIAQVEEFIIKPKRVEVVGPVEADPEYLVIVEANNLAAEIDNEIDIVHKFTKDKYSKRFPELESIVTGSLEYVSTVKELGNDLNKAKHNEMLQQVLAPATIMVICVTASTTHGQMLDREELHWISEACEMALDLNKCKLRIYEYVESRMSFIAPNLSMILNASSAAKLIGFAGGLTNLANLPACNIQVLGSQKKTLSGFSTTTILPHAGFIYFSEIVQATPPDLRRKAARVLAGKCALAARVDCSRTSVDGRVGRQFREEIEKKLDKLQEPPPVKAVKALPVPIEQQKKKRGGKRTRKMKERYGKTELGKQANRMNFGEIEEDAYQDNIGFSFGLIGKSGTGRIRAAQIDEKTKVRLSKTLQKNIQKQEVYGGSTSIRREVSGTASSVAFTPLQGLEITNPQAAEKKFSEDDTKYFSSAARFLKSGN